MKSFLLFLCLICASSALFADTANISQPKIKWRFKTGAPVRGDLVISNSEVYFGSTDGSAYALNTKDGSLRWRFDTQGAIAGPVAVDADFVVLSSRDNYVYALNRKDGSLRWKFKMQQERITPYSGWKYFAAAPLIHAEKVFVPSADGNLYALEKSTGKMLWSFPTVASMRATPLVQDGFIFQPSNDGRVYQLHLDSGRVAWIFETDGVKLNPADFGFDRHSIYTQPIKQGNMLYIAARDGNAYGIDVSKKEKVWNFTYGTTWAMSTALANDTLFVGWSTNNMVTALNAKTGEKRWDAQVGAHVYTKALVNNDVVYWGSADGNLYQFNVKTGAKNWAYNIGDEIYSSPQLDKASGSILFGSDDHNVYALEQASTYYKAVFLPENLEGMEQYFLADKKITPYLREHGYVQLDKNTLLNFMQARIADKAPSVIVFDFLVIPDNVLAGKLAQSIFIQYLKAGGKILWFGDAPNYYALDESGNSRRSADQGAALLQVKYIQATESGNYVAKATQAGLNWGLPAVLKTTATPIKEDGVIVPLAYDEFNRVSAYLKPYSERPYAGFVSFRPWSWNIPVSDENLKLIEKIASYGLE